MRQRVRTTIACVLILLYTAAYVSSYYYICVDRLTISERVPRDANFAAKWIGNIEIKTAGRYTFSTTSDDGSRLWINNQMVVDNGGYHAAQNKSGRYGVGGVGGWA
jgi:hypothetical protein